MTISTRSTYYPTVPNSSKTTKEYDTPTKTAFYDALDRSGGYKSGRRIAAEYAPSHRTAERWKEERRVLGSPSYRRTRKLSTRLGRPRKIEKATSQLLVDPNRNFVRTQTIEAQLNVHGINASVRTTQRSLLRDTNQGRKYKQAYVKKKLSQVNRDKRVAYGVEHMNKSIDQFWSHIFFTDEAHVDPSASSQGWILREQGTRYNEENIEERGELSGNKLHFATWINWYRKAKKLEFYHDEEERTEQPKRPPKPRRTMYEEEPQYLKRLAEWEALLPHKVDVKPKGNSMTQKYYVKRLLPVYIAAIQEARVADKLDIGFEENSDLVDWWLQEDNDGSHGHGRQSQNTKKTVTKSLATALKEDNWISTLTHPPQSPDLNPIEGIWCILKQRARQHTWTSLDELKKILQDEWDKITIEEIRERILEMPERCQRLVKTGGSPIKSTKW
jgi:hypothetical protein